MIELFNGGYHEIVLTGCIDKQALVQCSDGSIPTLGDLIGRRTSLLTVDSRKGVEHHQTTTGTDSGVKRVLELTLRNGMRVRLTPDHKVLTDRGWVRADSLDATQDHVLVPRHVTYRPSNFSLSDEAVKLIAYWTTDGSSSATRARFCDGRKETSLEVIQCLRKLGFDVTRSSPYQKSGSWEILVKQFATGGFRDWMKEHQIFCMGTDNADVPDSICRAPKRQVALFINRVWAAEGTVASSNNSPPRFQIGMKSEVFIRKLQLLLKRWGIGARISEVTSTRNGTECKQFLLQVTGKSNIERFHRAIGPIYSKEAETASIMEKVSGTTGNTNVDIVPLTWGQARDLLTDHGEPLGNWQRLSGGPLSERRNRRFSRKMFNKFCEDFSAVAVAEDLTNRFHETVSYERIKSITSVEHAIPVADIGVPGPHRFTANGIAVHNSIGWGKDYFATTCLVRILYELCCLRNPSRSLGLGAGEPIHIVPISRTVKAAKNVVFGGVAKKLALAPWFKGRYKETLDYIEFPEKRIMIVGGASSDAAALGLNVFSAIIDEGNFMGQVNESQASTSAGGKVYDRAQMIYDALVRRVKSRYQRSGVKGKVFLVSSKRATDDFTERRIREHISNKTAAGVFVRDYATWLVRPEPFEHQKWYRCSVSSAEGRCRILEEEEEPPEDALVFTFPEDYLSEFERDPAGATRDVAGIATDTYAPFISKREAIEDMFDPERPHLFEQREWEMGRPLVIKWDHLLTENARGERVPLCCSHAVRHVHLDLSKNMCATGFCIAHQAGTTEVIREDKETGKKSIEEAPVFHIDALLRILAGPAGDIDHGEVRGLVYKLNDGGFNIRSVSMDHWMSVPNMQLFKKHGFRVEEISTVKKIDPFDAMRSALYEQRIQSPEYDLLRNELRVLELDPKRPPTRPRVVVPIGHTKDLADAFAGAVYYLSVHSKGGVFLAPTLGTSVKGSGPKHSWKNSEPIWGDEEGYDSVPRPNAQDQGDQFDQAWII